MKNTTCTDRNKETYRKSHGLDRWQIAKREELPLVGFEFNHSAGQHPPHYRLPLEPRQEELTPQYAAAFLDSEHRLRSFVRNRNLAFIAV